MTRLSLHVSSCVCRVFGFSPIIQNNCSHTWKLIVHPERKWYYFVNPIMLLILYYTLATLIRLWLQEPIDQMTVSVQMSDDGRRFHFRSAVMFVAKSISHSAILRSLTFGELKRMLTDNCSLYVVIYFVRGKHNLVVLIETVQHIFFG